MHLEKDNILATSFQINRKLVVESMVYRPIKFIESFTVRTINIT